MRKFFTFFALAAFALVAGVSCQDPEVDTDPAVLTVGELAEISAGGGNCTLSYSVENPIEGEVVTATVPAEATWVHDITVGETAVEFVVDANNGDARSTTMTISYANLSPVEVTISQAQASDITIGMLAKVPAAGGNASFTYSVAAVEGATLTATVDDETTWIHDINVTATAVEFVVDANTSTSERMAVITLSYAGADKDVTITQEGAAPAEDAFEVSFSNVTPASANVSIVPKDKTVTYMFKPCTSSNLNSYEGATPEEKAAAYAISQAGTWLFPFWGSPNMDSFVTGDFPAEGQANEFSWILYSEDEVAYMLVAGINTDAKTKADITLTTAVTLVEVPLLPKPDITIAAETLEVSHEAGSNGTTFTVTNPIEGIKATASTKESWIKNINIVNDKIAFEYEENPYAAPRQATITFEYDYADYARNLVVKQAGNPSAEQHKFYITVKEVHYDHAVVDITPSNPNVKYLVGGASDYYIDMYSMTDDTTIISRTINSYNKIVKSGAQTGVKVNVSYVSDDYGWGAQIYAYAIDDTETVAISGVSRVATTLVNDKPGISFSSDDPNATFTSSSFGGLNLNVPAAAGTYTIKYTPNNLSESGLLKVEASGASYTVVDKSSIVLNTEAKTITFTTTANEGTTTKTDYIFFKYYSDPSNTTFTDLNASVKIVQAAPAN
ncbi:MAG: BACON domain-containing protein [Alistipes sp.]|nr:BACON domain-containing protein [Alistipes sp.]